MINAVWLRTFCSLVEEGHFTRTAKRLHMTQSGVSQHIQKLEQQLGLALLSRQGKQFMLTEAGERLYAEGRDLSSALVNLSQRIKDDPAYTGIVRVMSPGSVGLKLYPHLLALQCLHPKLVIDYRFAPNSAIEQAIAEQNVDIGFMTRMSSRAEVNCQSVAKETLLLVTPATFEPSTQPSWSDLEALGFIDHPDGAYHAGALLAANYPQFQHSNLLQKKGFSNQISLILQPVSLGLGFTVLPAYAVEAFAQPELINSYRLTNSVAETLYLGTRRDKSLPNRVQTVIAESIRRLKIA
ncbi:LysR family transcriptional regulator [Rheinheimera salexigens]|uniref:LysR family transcriptional regulator n=1 Tax=Rheinheimera salexigens TaxID=1628148 RepID=A0A1E7Q328_9GAMM|nr:LysR family transcriptional regulator [Rheinheimera salexigens]OEY68547.1 LysR family transcriptional regulator [Rheinheimera salexigens]